MTDMLTRSATAAPRLSPVQHLRGSMAAARLSFTWLGTRRSLSRQQKQEAADTFSAESRYLSAGKKLLDTSHPAFRSVSAIRTRAISYWRGLSLPYPEPGIRLIRQDRIDAFNHELLELREELTKAVGNLDRQYSGMREDARQRLGRLFNDQDYPPGLEGLFGLEWDFPSVEPPDYLRQLNPALYEQEAARVTARFEEAVTLAEQAFAAELEKLVSHLAERLSGTNDGKPKVFRDSVLSNLTEFFERFRHLNVRSSPQLDELVEQAQKVVRGVGATDLRSSQQLRQQAVVQLAAVQAQLDGLLVDRPRRRILRNSESSASPAAIDSEAAAGGEEGVA